MQPSLMIVVATAASVPLGLWLRHNLATLGYRHEDEEFLSQPGPRWWVVWTSVLTLGSLAAAAIISREPITYLPLLPLAVTGPWLAAVDFDVLRIPNRVLLPTTAVTTVAVVGVAVAERDWWALALPVAAAVVTGCVFASVHFATKGGIGFGDTKLAALIGLALGSVGLGAVWLGVLVGSVGALVWHRATRRASPIPYGPWLFVGLLDSRTRGCRSSPVSSARRIARTRNCLVLRCFGRKALGSSHGPSRCPSGPCCSTTRFFRNSTDLPTDASTQNTSPVTGSMSSPLGWRTR